MGSFLRGVINASPEALRRRIYARAKRYVDEREGNNNPDLATNGELRFLRARIPQCRVVFDVGANIGQWADAVLAINPEVQLHCFEPSKPAFDKLAMRHFPKHVVLNHFGLSSTTREARLFVFADASGMNSLYRRQGLEYKGMAPQAREETVGLRTLDEYCCERGIVHMDYLKLDVEGHELEVLRGGRTLLRAGGIGIVQFEYGGCNIDSRVLLKDLFDFVQDLPYTIYKILPDTIRRVPDYSQALENFQYSNWLLIHKGASPDAE